MKSIRSIIVRIFRGRVISLGRVRDVITFRESNEEIKLRVDADALTLMAGMKKLQATLGELDANDETAVRRAAVEFSECLFGAEQSNRIFQFYSGDARAVIRACGEYSKRYLLKRITKAQEKAGV
jgi:hypothetical protein